MNYYIEIKNELINNEITKRVKDYSKNRSDLTTYYNVGKLLSEAGKHYGEGIIKEYSRRLTNELGKGYTWSALKRMRQFFGLIEKGATMSHLLTWSHYIELLPLNKIEIINYYVKLIEQQNLSVRQLREKIKNKEYERLDNITKEKLIAKEETTLVDFIKNPIVIKNTTNKEAISEKLLQRIILEDIPSFLKELGNGFTFVENEYRIKKEHIGQIEVYMNYIDKNLRKVTQDKTIGIIICKKGNKFIMEYCSDYRILTKEYKLV